MLKGQGKTNGQKCRLVGEGVVGAWQFYAYCFSICTAVGNTISEHEDEAEGCRRNKRYDIVSGEWDNDLLQQI